MLGHAMAGMALAMACAIAPAQRSRSRGGCSRRVGVLMVWNFALEDKASGKLAGAAIEPVIGHLKDDHRMRRELLHSA